MTTYVRFRFDDDFKADLFVGIHLYCDRSPALVAQLMETLDEAAKLDLMWRDGVERGPG